MTIFGLGVIALSLFLLPRLKGMLVAMRQPSSCCAMMVRECRRC